MVALSAPVLLAFAVSPETIFALGQGEDGLPVSISGLVVAGVAAAVEGIDFQACLGNAAFVFDGDGQGNGGGYECA